LGSLGLVSLFNKALGSSIIYYTTTLPSIPTEKAKALPIVLLSGKEIIFFHKIS